MLPNYDSDQTDLQKTFARRKAAFNANVESNKRNFIRDQISLEVVSFLKHARDRLDTCEAQMEAKLNKPKSSSFFSLFSSRARVAPTPVLKELSQEARAEFETARYMLLDISNSIVHHAGENDSKKVAQALAKQFQNDLNILKEPGGRISRHWNDVNDTDLFSYEKDERQLLGTIKEPQIISILKDVDEALDEFPARIYSFLQTTKARVPTVMMKAIDTVYDDFAKTSLGRFVVCLAEEKTAPAQLKGNGHSPATLARKIHKLQDETAQAKSVLLPTERKMAERIQQSNIDLNSRLDVLLIALPDKQLDNLTRIIDSNIHMKKQSVSENNQRYAR